MAEGWESKCYLQAEAMEELQLRAQSDQDEAVARIRDLEAELNRAYEEKTEAQSRATEKEQKLELLRGQVTQLTQEQQVRISHLLFSRIEVSLDILSFGVVIRFSVRPQALLSDHQHQFGELRQSLLQTQSERNDLAAELQRLHSEDASAASRAQREFSQELARAQAEIAAARQQAEKVRQEVAEDYNRYMLVFDDRNFLQLGCRVMFAPTQSLLLFTFLPVNWKLLTSSCNQCEPIILRSWL